MARPPKEPTFYYYVYKNGEKVNIDTLTQEERDRLGVMAYQKLVKALGYVPVTEAETILKRK